MASFDVIVVGAGVVGCSSAYRLAESGLSVLVVDQRGIASGASGRNGGMTGAGSTMYASAANAVYAITSSNFALMRTLAEELETDFELRLPGSLNVATTEEQWDHLTASARLQQEAGLRVELLGPDDARHLIPALSDKIVGAEFSTDMGHLWPFALVHGFARQARQRGAIFRLGHRVDSLIRDGDRVTGVRIGSEQVLAERVVLCTNSWTPQILPDLPAGAIVPARGQILVTQALPPIIGHSFGTNFDKEYGRQTPDGKILCGGFRRLDEDEGLGHYEEKVSAPVLSGIASCLTTLFPRIGAVRIVRCWAGIMGFTADGLPVIGNAPFAPGLTIAAGFNGGGFSWAAMTGKIVARLVNGDDPGFDLHYFRPDRFFESGVAWANPFTAGEQSMTAAA